MWFWDAIDLMVAIAALFVVPFLIVVVVKDTWMENKDRAALMGPRCRRCDGPLSGRDLDDEGRRHLACQVWDEMNPEGRS